VKTGKWVDDELDEDSVTEAKAKAPKKPSRIKM